MKRLLAKNTVLAALCLAFVQSAAPQTNDSWKLYDDSHIPRIDVTINPALLDWIFSHPESDSEHVASVRFRNSWIDESVDSIGFRLRGNTSRQSKKQSFKVSFNTFIKGREFHGVDKLNLNGEHNDPSIIRSKLCFDLFADIGMRASRANHVQLFINGQYRGLYISVEHVDDEFLEKQFADDTGNLWKCLYPADLQYLGADPNLYRLVNSGGRPAYELKTNEELADFTALARFVDVVNNTPFVNLPDSLERMMDIPALLKYFAVNILTGSWDDYWSLMNNYYLYHEPSRDRFTLIPYDYDNSFGIDWFDVDWSAANPYVFPKVASGPRPLAERVLGVAQYRDLYTHFLDFYSTAVFPLSFWEERIDRLRTMVTPAALADSFRTLDYGFDSTAFMNSYSATPYQNQHVKFGLKQFVNARMASIGPQLLTVGSRPMVYAQDITPRTPRAGDSIWVSASCYASAGIALVQGELLKAGDSLPILIPLTASPVAMTKKVEEADRWTGVIPPLAAGSYTLRFFIQDGNGLTARSPLAGPVAFRVAFAQESAVVINEFMADNDAMVTDPSGEYDDWVELYNRGSSPVLLSGMYMTDKSDNLVKWRFSQENLVLDPGEFIVLWCDEQETQPGLHTNFKLSVSGEYIALVDTDGVSVLDSITFATQQTDVAFGRYPDGSTHWQALFPTAGSSNTITAITDEVLPTSFSLSAYPNPFNPDVTLAYSLPGRARVELSIHDLLGRTVWMTAEEQQGPGQYATRWNGIGLDGRALSSGLYLARLRTGDTQKTLRLLLLK